jgi:hypothetical protein
MKYKNKESKKNNVIQLFQPENHDYVISDKIDLDKIKTINFSIDNIDNKE